MLIVYSKYYELDQVWRNHNGSLNMARLSKHCCHIRCAVQDFWQDKILPCRKIVREPWTCNVQAAEKALRAAHLSQDSNHMPSSLTTNLSELSAGIVDAGISAAAIQLAVLLKDPDYLRYPSRHASPLVPHDVINVGTMESAIELTTRLLNLCQQFIDRQWPLTVEFAY